MGQALLWGALAASSLLVGAVLGVVRSWPQRLIGVVLAFGAGALISSVAFELAEEGLESGGPVPVAIGIALGAIAFTAGNAKGGTTLSGQPAAPQAPGPATDRPTIHRQAISPSLRRTIPAPGYAAVPPTVRPDSLSVGCPTPTGTPWPFLPHVPMPASIAG